MAMLLPQWRCSGPTERGFAWEEWGEGEDVRDIEDQANSSLPVLGLNWLLCTILGLWTKVVALAFFGSDPPSNWVRGTLYDMSLRKGKKEEENILTPVRSTPVRAWIAGGRVPINLLTSCKTFAMQNDKSILISKSHMCGIVASPNQHNLVGLGKRSRYLKLTAFNMMLHSLEMVQEFKTTGFRDLETSAAIWGRASRTRERMAASPYCL